jgi:hypothetical protein
VKRGKHIQVPKMAKVPKVLKILKVPKVAVLSDQIIPLL